MTVAAPSEFAAAAAQRERTIAELRAIEPELRRQGVVGLRLYGSLARGEATPASDVDLLLTPAPDRTFSLLDMSNVRLLVTERLDREAGVVVEDDVSPEFRARIAGDLVTVY
jgi:predicted nucleotidyltransferase